MIIDAKNILADDVAAHTSAAFGTSIDFGRADPNDGDGVPVRYRIVVTEAYAGGTSMVFNVQDSADDATYATIQSTGAIALADLTLGAEFDFFLPPKFRQYLKMSGTATGAFTAGKVSVVPVPV